MYNMLNSVWKERGGDKNAFSYIKSGRICKRLARERRLFTHSILFLHFEPYKVFPLQKKTAIF